MQALKFHRGDLDRMRTLLEPFVLRTPVLPSLASPGLFFKTENLQNTNSFKVRAAAGQILSLPRERLERGLVTSSSGNFGQAAAYVARLVGTSLQVVMTRDSNPLKVELTRQRGAEIVFCENDAGTRQARVDEIEAAEGATQIHPFNHPDAIVGNASLALEVLEQHPRTKHLVAPISGGGLMAGVALGAKLVNPSVHVWGVQPEASNATFLSFQAGRIVSVDRNETMADGLRVNQPGDLTFPLVREHVDSVVTVPEAAILKAVAHFLLKERLVVEPSGAVGMAAVLEGLVPAADTVLVLSGGNIDPDLARRALTAGV